MNESYKKINRVLIFILILNFAVCGAKIVTGLATSSASIVADGFHSLSDGSSNIIGLIGIWLASRPIDEKHQYGHKKIETFSTMIIAIFLFMVSYQVIVTAIERFKNPAVIPTVSAVSFIVMTLTLMANIWITKYETKIGKELNSDFLVSDAMHTASDIYVSISVIIGLIVVKLGFPIVDIVVSVVIALIIIKAGIDIVMHSADILCDAAPIKAEEIESVVGQIESVKVCHKVRTRGREDDVHVDLHVWVDKEMNIEDGHHLSHNIEGKIKNKFCGVTEVIVHIEPNGLTEVSQD